MPNRGFRGGGGSGVGGRPNRGHSYIRGGPSFTARGRYANVSNRPIDRRGPSQLRSSRDYSNRNFTSRIRRSSPQYDRRSNEYHDNRQNTNASHSSRFHSPLPPLLHPNEHHRSSPLLPRRPYTPPPILSRQQKIDDLPSKRPNYSTISEDLLKKPISQSEKPRYRAGSGHQIRPYYRTYNNRPWGSRKPIASNPVEKKQKILRQKLLQQMQSGERRSRDVSKSVSYKSRSPDRKSSESPRSRNMSHDNVSTKFSTQQRLSKRSWSQKSGSQKSGSQKSGSSESGSKKDGSFNNKRKSDEEDDDDKLLIKHKIRTPPSSPESLPTRRTPFSIMHTSSRSSSPKTVKPKLSEANKIVVDDVPYKDSNRNRTSSSSRKSGSLELEENKLPKKNNKVDINFNKHGQSPMGANYKPVSNVQEKKGKPIDTRIRRQRSQSVSPDQSKYKTKIDALSRRSSYGWKMVDVEDNARLRKAAHDDVGASKYDKGQNGMPYNLSKNKSIGEVAVIADKRFQTKIPPLLMMDNLGKNSERIEHYKIPKTIASEILDYDKDQVGMSRRSSYDQSVSDISRYSEAKSRYRGDVDGSIERKYKEKHDLSMTTSLNAGKKQRSGNDKYESEFNKWDKHAYNDVKNNSAYNYNQFMNKNLRNPSPPMSQRNERFNEDKHRQHSPYYKHQDNKDNLVYHNKTLDNKIEYGRNVSNKDVTNKEKFVQRYMDDPRLTTDQNKKYHDDSSSEIKKKKVPTATLR